MTVSSPRSLTLPLFSLLRQGITPERLALSIALGIGISCFPVFGTTTILCALVAIAFRLNPLAIQVGNYLALPLQLALCVPFLRFGELLFHATPLPLEPKQLLAMSQSAPDQTARVLVLAQYHAIIGWLIVAPFIIVPSLLLLRPLIRLLVARASAVVPATSQP